jgi:eukaryotic-like serine/threonine-protein kinase
MSDPDPAHPVDSSQQHSAADRLDSWKEIAGFLKRDVRTVQRWEKDEGLIVHRHLHGRQGSVYAYRAELDEWWSSRRTQLDGQAMPRHWARTWWVTSACLGLTAIVVTALQIRAREPLTESYAIRFTVPAPEKTAFRSLFAEGVAPAAARISPDGRKIAFTAANSSRNVTLWVRLLDAPAAQPLPDTDGATLPFWSPDSRWIGYFADGRLKKVDVRGESSQTLCEVRGEWGGSWNGDGTIVFSAAGATGSMLYRVSASGGEASAITKAGSGNHQFPQFLPDGRHLLFYASSLTPYSKHVESDRIQNTGVHVIALDGSDDRRLLEADSAAIYASPGYLLFVRQGVLFAQPFNAKRLELRNETFRLAETVPFEINAAAFSVSDNAVLTYVTGPIDQDRQFAWFDRSGNVIETVGVPGDYRGVDLSPDGTRLAVHRHDGKGGDAWVLEPRGATRRLTFDASQDNSSPIWSPDGGRIVFSSLRKGKWGLYRKSSDGTGDEDLLVESVLPKAPMAWSPDGRYIIYFVADPESGRDQWLLSIDGDRRTVPLLNSRFNEDHPQISPNGQWLAYVSNSSGVAQVYVKRFPSGDGIWPVSAGGGWWPRWRRDGKEIFYLEGSKLMAVPVNSARTLEIGEARELFDSHVSYPHHTTTINLYAVSSNGQRFLFPIAGSNKTTTAFSPITVVLNWTSTLKP